MTVNTAKGKGTWVETQVVRYAKAWGLPLAQRIALAGSADRGDVMLIPKPMIIVECKWANRRVQLKPWLRELLAETSNARAVAGLLVAKQQGAGDQSIARWFTAMPVDQWRLIGGRDPSQLGWWSGAKINTVTPTNRRSGGYVETILGPDHVVPLNPGDLTTPPDWSSLRLVDPVGGAGNQVPSVVVGPLWIFLHTICRWHARRVA